MFCAKALWPTAACLFIASVATATASDQSYIQQIRSAWQDRVEEFVKPDGWLTGLDGGRFRFTAPTGGGVAGEVAHFAEVPGRPVRMFGGDSWVDRISGP